MIGIVLKCGAIAKRSIIACVSSEFVVGVLGSNPAWRHFFLNKKKIVFQELDGQLNTHG